MTDVMNRKLPAGLQSFKVIREEGYLYVDKSDVVWHLANSGKKYNYLSRPRRFGKSILVDTLESYLLGKKELFEGLKIMQLEKEWNHCPPSAARQGKGNKKNRDLQEKDRLSRTRTCRIPVSYISYTTS